MEPPCKVFGLGDTSFRFFCTLCDGCIEEMQGSPEQAEIGLSIGQEVLQELLKSGEVIG